MSRKQRGASTPRLTDKRRAAWSKGRRGLSPWFWVSVLVVATVVAVAVYVYFSLLHIDG